MSSRVIEKARRSKDYLYNLETVSSTTGSLNIELLISLIESSKVHGWADKADQLKELVKRDIQSILTVPRLRRFYLHRALIQFHQQRDVQKKEKVNGYISLNYDIVLDHAYRKFHGEPNYCFTLDHGARSSGNTPLLKLHGSFNWNAVRIRGRRREVEIIPVGSHKTYLHAPYEYIWSWALDTLTTCDTLRVVGCSLSQNDEHLIELLFKAHLERRATFEIEVIASERTGEQIRANYGFFPKIKTLSAIEDSLVPEPDPVNPFKTWLKYKSLRMLGSRRIKRLEFVKKVVG